MRTDLPRLVPDHNQRRLVQETDFTMDALGRDICTTWDEATENGGVAVDGVEIGSGMFGPLTDKRSNWLTFSTLAESWLILPRIVRSRGDFMGP